ARDPGLEVNAVGDMSDRYLVDGQSRPEATPLLASHLAVQAAHAVASTGQAQGEHCGAKRVTRVLGPVPPERAEGLKIDPELRRIRREVAIGESGREIIVACGDGGVCREEQSRRGGDAGFAEGEPVADHQLTNALQPSESGVTLVEVCHLGIASERCQPTHAADTENQLLLDSRLLVAAVEPGGYVAVAPAV